MGLVSWLVVQRLCDDEPPLLVWREERGMTSADLAAQTGIPMARLGELELSMDAATEAEINRLATAFRIPIEYLAVPRPMVAG